MAEAAARPSNLLGNWLDAARAARRPFVSRPGSMFRNIRFVVPACIILVCGCFAAAALVQMRLDRAHVLEQATGFAQRSAANRAMVVGGTLDRFARMGAVFAGSPQQYRSADLSRAEPAIRDIAVFDASSALLSRLNATATTPVAAPVFTGARAVLPGKLAVRRGGQTITVLFDARSLGGATADPQPGAITAPVPGWPLFAVAAVDQDAALRGWRGMLPLYLFVILGPALAGGWLAALFVSAFERQAKAARTVRALKSARPVEARLMVRLANAERGAAEALRSKSEFIAHMSHELRTPLNAVIGFSEVIAEEFYGPAGHPKYSEYARDIGDAGRNLHAKIGDILEFANIEAGRFPLKTEAVDLMALAGACVDEHQGRAFSRRIALSVGVCEPGAVRADALAVKRILSNLLANALTYTGEGGFVRADVRFEEGAGIITLSDSGMGFTNAERPKAGKAFQRFDRAGTVTGAGLGLAIALELARRMGGAMRLASEGGSSATMELRLPRL
jgi:signal transduction histidine kinase